MSGRTLPSTSTRSWQIGLLAGGLAALVICRFVTMSDDAAFYRGWLVGYLACWEATVGCLGILMLHHLMGGNWGRGSRGVFDAGADLLPLTALMFVPIALNVEQIFPWAGEEAAHDPLLQKKAAFLNEQAFLIRAGIYYAVFAVCLAMVIPARGRLDPRTQQEALFPRRGALGLMLIILAVSFGAVDWGMTLEPHWFSAIYGGLYVIGGAVVAMALAILAVAWLRRGRSVPGVARKRVRNDLGSLLLAMLMIWAYFGFSQYLIIWSADLPEENFWYLKRGEQGWQLLVILILAFHFASPFAALVTQDTREHPTGLTAVAVTVLIAHALHLVWLIAPAFYDAVTDVPWTLPVTMAGQLAIWGAGWLALLERRSTTAPGGVV